MDWVWFGLVSLTQWESLWTWQHINHPRLQCNWSMTTPRCKFPSQHPEMACLHPLILSFFLKDMRISHKLAGELRGKSQLMMDASGNSHQTALREIPASQGTLTYWYYKTAEGWMEASPQRNRFPAVWKIKVLKTFLSACSGSWDSKAAQEPSRGCKAHCDIAQSQLENLISGPSTQRAEMFDRGELL